MLVHVSKKAALLPNGSLLSLWVAAADDVVGGLSAALPAAAPQSRCCQRAQRYPEASVLIYDSTRALIIIFYIRGKRNVY